MVRLRGPFHRTLSRWEIGGGEADESGDQAARAMRG